MQGGYPPPPNNYPPPGGPPPGGYGAAPGAFGAPPAMAQANAPYGIDPVTGMPFSDKQKMTAGILSLFLGGFGVGRFYLGYTGLGIAQLLTFGGCGIWSMIDGILILTGKVPDAQGRPLRD